MCPIPHNPACLPPRLFAFRGVPGQRAPRSALVAWHQSLLALGTTTVGPLEPSWKPVATKALFSCRVAACIALRRHEPRLPRARVINLVPPCEVLSSRFGPVLEPAHTTCAPLSSWPGVALSSVQVQCIVSNRSCSGSAVACGCRCGDTVDGAGRAGQLEPTWLALAGCAPWPMASMREVL